jgi:hypothetical protein
VTAADTRQFTPNEIAVGVAKALIHHAEQSSDAWQALVAERGIELAEDGAFTITTEGGQTFHLTVVDRGNPPRPFVDAASAIHRTQRPDPQDVAAQVARIVTHCTVDGAPEWAEQAAAKLPPEILPQLAVGARALASVLARSCLCEAGDACRQSGCPACAELSPWSECRVAELGPFGGAR